jgi:hypothetical protein
VIPVVRFVIGAVLLAGALLFVVRANFQNRRR